MSRRDRRRAARLGLEPLEGRDVPAGNVVGTLFNDLDGDGAQGSGEPGIGGVEVEYRNGYYELLGTDTTAADGSYEFIGLPVTFGTVEFVIPGAMRYAFFYPANSSHNRGEIADVADGVTLTVDVPAYADPVISVARVSDAVEGGANGVFRFSRTEWTGHDLTINYTVQTGESDAATPWTDYSGLPGYVTFGIGESTVDVEVWAYDEGVFDPGEMVTVTVDESIITITDPNPATLTIVDVPPVVSVEKIEDAAENGADGIFRFTRSGNPSSALTVRYVIDETDSDEIATPSTDYLILGSGGAPGFVTFPAGVASLDVTVSVASDNEFEETELVPLTLLPSDSTPEHYTLGGSSVASVSITDSPPVVSFTAEWFSTGDTIGYVTLTRSGGNIAEPLTAWFEPEGTAVIDGESVRAVMAATAVFPAGQTALLVTITSQAVAGGFFNIQMQNAQPQGQRADQTDTLGGFLTGVTGHGIMFAEFIIDPTKLPNPLTWRERSLLREVAYGGYAGSFGSQADEDAATLAARQVLNRTALDWRSLPDAFAPHRTAAAAAAGYVAILGTPGWAKTEARIQQLLLDLGSEDHQTRERASSGLGTIIRRFALNGDFGQLALVYDRLNAALASTTNAEVRARLQALAPYYDLAAVDLFVMYKIRVAASIAGWTPYSLPIVLP